MREFLPTLTPAASGSNKKKAVTGGGRGRGEREQDESVTDETVDGGGVYAVGGGGGRAWQGGGASDGLPFRYVVTDVAQVGWTTRLDECHWLTLCFWRV